MKWIGLTGGIACGKSVISREFERLGVPVIDTDILAREVVEPGEDGYKAVVSHFGTAILDANGAIDRSALRKIVFANAEERVWLESLLHPLVKSRVRQLAAQLDAPYLVVVVPLLVESAMVDWFDRIVVVDTEPEAQLKRIIERDNIERKLAEKMVAAQIDRQKRLSYADDILYNNAGIEQLVQEVERLHSQYQSQYQC